MHTQIDPKPKAGLMNSNITKTHICPGVVYVKEV